MAIWLARGRPCGRLALLSVATGSGSGRTVADHRDGKAETWKGRIVTYRDGFGRDRWRREEPPEPPDYAATGVIEPRRAATVGEVPLGAQRLAEGAARAGWRGVVTYARGWRWARRGRPSQMVIVEVPSVAVRLVHDTGWRAVGVWEAGKTAGAWVWLPAGSMPYLLPRDIGVKALKEWIEARGRLTVAQAIEASKWSDGDG